MGIFSAMRKYMLWKTFGKRYLRLIFLKKSLSVANRTSKRLFSDRPRAH